MTMKIGTDKIVHCAVCALATIVIGCACGFINTACYFLCGVLFALGLGFGKECGDWFNPNSKWDWKDLLADLCGCAVGELVLLLFWVFV